MITTELTHRHGDGQISTRYIQKMSELMEGTRERRGGEKGRGKGGDI